MHEEPGKGRVRRRRPPPHHHRRGRRPAGPRLSSITATEAAPVACRCRHRLPQLAVRARRRRAGRGQPRSGCGTPARRCHGGGGSPGSGRQRRTGSKSFRWEARAGPCRVQKTMTRGRTHATNPPPQKEEAVTHHSPQPHGPASAPSADVSALARPTASTEGPPPPASPPTRWWPPSPARPPCGATADSRSRTARPPRRRCRRHHPPLQWRWKRRRPPRRCHVPAPGSSFRQGARRSTLARHPHIRNGHYVFMRPQQPQ